MNSIEQKWNTNKQYIWNRFYNLINFWVEKEKNAFFDSLEKKLDLKVNKKNIRNPREILLLLKKEEYKTFIWLYHDYLEDWFSTILWNIDNPTERIQLKKYIKKLIKWHMIWLYIHSGWLENIFFHWRWFILETTKSSLIKNFSNI